MTQQEIDKKTKEKVDKANAFLQGLQLSITAEQKIFPEGFIRNVVYFHDNEQYPKTIETVAPKTTEEVKP